MESFRDEVVETIVKDVSHLAVPEPKITDDDVNMIHSLLQPGDIIFCRRDYEISNAAEKLLTGSFWGHAALFLGDCHDGGLPVFEAVTTDGFRRASVARVCLTKDAIGIGRLAHGWTLDQLDLMEFQGVKWLGQPYNFAMDWDIEGKLYCSQAVAKLWQLADSSIVFHQTNKLGMEVSPQNLWDSVKQIATFGEKP